jgi:hypothetical protein
MNDLPGRSFGWRRFARPVWIVPGVSVLALGAITIWWLARGPVAEKEVRKRSVAEAAARGAAFADLLAALRAEPNPMAFVEARAGRDDSQAVSDLIQAYAAWASRGDALDARRAIVKRFLEGQDLKAGVAALFKAVALDTTPRRQDPMWRDLVTGVSGLWNAMTIAWGRDLVHIETDPKTKDLLLESLAQVSPKTIGAEQQNLLVTDLIDLYPTAAADQKVALNAAIAAMAGPDVVEILNRRGINEGSVQIASIQKIDQEVQSSRAQYKKVLEQIEKEEREAQETNAREAAKSKR